MLVRLDVWHFMRRLAVGCTSESHPLYGMFMAKLSTAIFEWDPSDYGTLVRAKLGEVKSAAPLTLLPGKPSASPNFLGTASDREGRLTTQSPSLSHSFSHSHKPQIVLGSLC